ncbi:hypothetical protein OIDMADRAFT_56816 [Oidiodendron maius Zn]|uniref:Uncharacterized protein n=1 Tax=Oidiodendron maius (strain Zn) TaxID=913774 RepID=A0A0C3GQY5_OIDMZ|nr:hypothetical protein OIDMADRAFT_56816 [Oidiodendron maius Zn]
MARYGKQFAGLSAGPQEAQVLGEQEDTMADGFEEGDPTNWTQLAPSRSLLKDMWNLD